MLEELPQDKFSNRLLDTQPPKHSYQLFAIIAAIWKAIKSWLLKLLGVTLVAPEVCSIDDIVSQLQELEQDRTNLELFSATMTQFNIQLKECNLELQDSIDWVRNMEILLQINKVTKLAYEKALVIVTACIESAGLFYVQILESFGIAAQSLEFFRFLLVDPKQTTARVVEIPPSGIGSSLENIEAQLPAIKKELEALLNSIAALDQQLEFPKTQPKRGSQQDTLRYSMIIERIDALKPQQCSKKLMEQLHEYHEHRSNFLRLLHVIEGLEFRGLNSKVAASRREMSIFEGRLLDLKDYLRQMQLEIDSGKIFQNVAALIDEKRRTKEGWVLILSLVTAIAKHFVASRYVTLDLNLITPSLLDEVTEEIISLMTDMGILDTQVPYSTFIRSLGAIVVNNLDSVFIIARDSGLFTMEQAACEGISIDKSLTFANRISDFIDAKLSATGLLRPRLAAADLTKVQQVAAMFFIAKIYKLLFDNVQKVANRELPITEQYHRCSL